MKDLKELAAQYGLETIAVNVIGESGLRDAIVNFTTMQQAEDFAYKHGLLVDKFENKGGKSSFYEPCGYYPENGFNIYDAYRKKSPQWRLEIMDNVDKVHLADSLRKAAEWLTKR